jgi:ubiquinone/menaquinone biosynthesis C-methylase UbiE
MPADTTAIPLGNTYDKYGTRNPIARALVGNFLASARQLAESVEAPAILEVGCGEGHLSTRLAEWKPAARIFGVDLSESLFDPRARALPRLHFSSQTAYALAFPADSFDLVVGAEVLEHLDQPERALEEMRRVARRYALLSVPREPLWRVLNVARLAYLRDWGNTPGHLQHWSSPAFVALVSRYFRPLRILHPLPWTMLLGEK